MGLPDRNYSIYLSRVAALSAKLSKRPAATVCSQLPTFSTPNSMPWASGISRDQFVVQV